MAGDGTMRSEGTDEIFQIRKSSVTVPAATEPRWREDEQMSDEGSDVQEADLDGSVVSSVTDRYGFMSGDGEETDMVVVETKTDLEIVRRREVKWVEMMSSWDSYMMRFVLSVRLSPQLSLSSLVFRNYKKVRERCRKGIPPSCRARAWLHLCGAKYQMDKTDNRWSHWQGRTQSEFSFSQHSGRRGEV